MAKTPKPTPTPETFPTEGGSYVRDPDGNLNQVEQTKPAPAAGAPDETQPATSTTVKE